LNPNEKTMRRSLIHSAVFGLLAAGCLLVAPGESESTWLAYTPIQCMGNPWERDWLESHDGDYGSYPSDEIGRGEVIREFYRRQDITIQQVRTEVSDGAVCLSCDCPAGYTLFVSVPTRQVERMQELGFRLPNGAD
jgi:hypothetical protein